MHEISRDEWRGVRDRVPLQANTWDHLWRLLIRQTCIISSFFYDKSIASKESNVEFMRKTGDRRCDLEFHMRADSMVTLTTS